MRWIGIDEAGYGPNLGPLVMTAVVAEGPGERAPNPWRDCRRTVARAGGRPEALWIDDSKRIYRAGVGLDRLEAASLAALAAAGNVLPTTLADLLMLVGVPSLDQAELTLWLEDRAPPAVPRAESRDLVDQMLGRRPLNGARWRIIEARTVIVGPARFNADLGATGSKANVHFAAFARLLEFVWERAGDGVPTRIRADKHGGRHFYLEPLYRALPDAWIDRGDEGAETSQYTLRQGSRRVELELCPRADAEDGLVALASIISKCLREFWMSVFNAHWTARIPDLKPTAGYPGDSARFRAAIEPDCRARALDPALWWRER
jgi:hypothetical protein